MPLMGLVLPLLVSCSTMPRHGAESGVSSGADMTVAALENTYWKLTRLGDGPVPVAPQPRAPHLILHPRSHGVSGSGGCNRLIGSYELEGERLTFGQLASTRMACAEGMQLEAAFLAALEKVRSWNIVGRHLDLFDDAGDAVAGLEARSSEGLR